MILSPYVSTPSTLDNDSRYGKNARIEDSALYARLCESHQIINSHEKQCVHQLAWCMSAHAYMNVLVTIQCPSLIFTTLRFIYNHFSYIF